MKKKVIVIGAGFAGIQLVKKLDGKLFDILLIDKLNHHQFQPLLYQVATSQLEPSSISFPIRNIFSNKNNVQIRLAEVVSVDTAGNKINTSIGEFAYDYLVVATGCKTNFFGNTEMIKNCFTLKSTYDAITIRNHILQTFENIISAKENEKDGLLNLVIAGAGPTGVELAGAFAEIKKHILPKDYPGIDWSQFKIILIEGSSNTLNNMSENAKSSSQKYLQEMGVNIITGTFVKKYDGHLLELSNNEFIRTKTVIWAAGVTGNPIPGLPTGSITFGNRFKVNRINKIEGSDNVYAIGDICYMETPQYTKGHPQVANVAMSQAKRLASNLSKIEKGKQTTDFEYKDLGTMATIGRNKAVVDFKYINLKGFSAWIIWMGLHLMLILNVKNRLLIFINWAWAYITKDTSLRLILTQKRDCLNRE